MGEALGLLEVYGLVAAHVIPSPHTDVELILPKFNG